MNIKDLVLVFLLFLKRSEYFYYHTYQSDDYQTSFMSFRCCLLALRHYYLPHVSVSQELHNNLMRPINKCSQQPPLNSSSSVTFILGKPKPPNSQNVSLLYVVHKY